MKQTIHVGIGKVPKEFLSGYRRRLRGIDFEDLDSFPFSLSRFLDLQE